MCVCGGGGGGGGGVSEIRQTWGGGGGGACPKRLKTPVLGNRFLRFDMDMIN